MIFRHRRLLALSFLTLLATFLAQALPHGAKPLFLCAISVLLALFLLLFFLRRTPFFLVLCCLLALLAMLSSFRISSQREALRSHDGEEIAASVTVREIFKKENEGQKTLGEGTLSFSDGGKHFRVKVSFSAEGDFAVGDVLYGECRLQLLSEDSYGAASDRIAKLSFSSARAVDRIEDLSTLLPRWREKLCGRLYSALPNENGSLLCALLLGVRDGLSTTTERDMSRIGTVHMLSLSGLHLAILAGALSALLSPLHLGRRLRTAILILFSFFFMIFTGLASSVMRAGLMLLFSSLPLFLREERDSLSSLFGAVALICLAEPYAVKDLSLWLSALSTLGILLLFDRYKSQRAHDGFSLLRSIRRTLVFSLAVTLSATVATLPLTVLIFGTLPLLSPLANLVLTFPMQLALYLSIPLLIFPNFTPLIYISDKLCNLIFTISTSLSDIPHTVLPLSSTSARAIVLAYSLLTLCYFLFAPRRRFSFRVPLILSLCFIAILSAFLGTGRLLRGNDLHFAYFSSEEESADTVLLRVKNKRLMIVASKNSRSGSAEEAMFYETAKEADALLLSHYSDACADYLSDLLSQYKVHCLYLPTPRSHEIPSYQEALRVAARFRVPTVTAPSDLPFSFDGVSVTALASDLKFGKVTGIFLEIRHGDALLQYYGGEGLSSVRTQRLAEADAVLFGAFGGERRVCYAEEHFLSPSTRLLCPSPAYFPFRSKGALVYTVTGQALLPFEK